jgi:hypothetical protein
MLYEKTVRIVTPQDGPTDKIFPKRSGPIVALFSLPKMCSSTRKILGIEVSFTYKDPMNNVYPALVSSPLY